MTEPASPPPLSDELRPASRAAVVVYRAARRELCEEYAAHAATGAYLALRPNDGWDKAVSMRRALVAARFQPLCTRPLRSRRG